MRKPKETISVAQVTTQPIFAKSPDFKTYYANNVKIGMTSNDFSLICGQINSPDKEGDAPVVEDQLSIRLSPQTFRIMASALNSALDGWEKIFGKLPELSPGIVNNKGIAASLDLLQDKIRKLSDES
jgi:hypothetical protein